MKKLISIILVLSMLFCLPVVSALAADDDHGQLVVNDVQIPGDGEQLAGEDEQMPGASEEGEEKLTFADRLSLAADGIAFWAETFFRTVFIDLPLGIPTFLIMTVITVITLFTM